MTRRQVAELANHRSLAVWGAGVPAQAGAQFWWLARWEVAKRPSSEKEGHLNPHFQTVFGGEHSASRLMVGMRIDCVTQHAQILYMMQ